MNGRCQSKAVWLGLLVGILGWPIAAARADEPIHWRTDYNAARKEAEEKGRPLFIEVGTESCFYCRKLEAGPLREPAILRHLETDFIPLKIDANREPALARALKVNLYPTLVLAGVDGKIHSFLEGYVEAPRIEEQMDRLLALNGGATPIQLQQGLAAAAIADYARAVALLKPITATDVDPTTRSKARDALMTIEAKAARALVLARLLEEQPDFDELTDALADVAATYRGTRAALEAEELLSGLGDIPDRRLAAQKAERHQRAKELLYLAQQEFKQMQYAQCLQHCRELAALDRDFPELRQGAELVEEIQSDPERIAIAQAQQREREAAMHMAFAESWKRNGYYKEAARCWEQVLQLAPHSRIAEEAKAQLTRLEKMVEAQPTGRSK